MPKTNSPGKPVKSFRLSVAGIGQLKEMAFYMGRSESDVLEVALDRMYREEIRFNQAVREKFNPQDQYKIDHTEKEKNEID